jgi:hypothetical protein
MCLSAFPCPSTSCSNSQMHALCAAITTSFCPRHPHSENGQLSPLAALCSSCFHSPHAPSYTVCTLLFPCIHTSPSAVRTEKCQSLPGATSSAVAMVWTCFLAISRSLLCLILLGGGSPYSMYSSLVSPFSSGLDLQSISCPNPFYL